MEDMPAVANDRPSSAPLNPATTAVVVVEDFRARLQLRGLLQMHQVRLAGEAESLRKGLDLVRATRPTHLLIQSTTDENACFQLIADAHSAVPTVKVILIRPAAQGYSPPANSASRPDILLREPYSNLEFAQALFSSGFEPSATRSAD
jgi:hypothetical protein